ncbi:LOW QUALITY PROTEIN: uncharacterized protein PAF06_013610 [Gastrophryne carolinensis]
MAAARPPLEEEDWESVFKTNPYMGNKTILHKLLLSGLSDVPSLQMPLFLFFLLIYLLTLTWNLLIIVLIVADHHLHTPMYFFLGTLASLDLCFSSVTVPRMLFDLRTRKNVISTMSCMTQVFFFLFFAASEATVLAVMSYDRYVAICYPLHYMQIINWKLCLQLASSGWVVGAAYSVIQTFFATKLKFCRSKNIESFFCDLPQLFQISCSDVFINILLIFLLGGFIGIGSLIIIFMSYIYIFKTVLRMRIKGGRSKVFSTCSSHLMVVFAFYGTFTRSFSGNKVVSVFYTAISPLLNPLIYSLRNQDFRGAAIESFFCDLPQLFRISCSDVFTNVLLIFLLGGFIGIGSLIIIFMSYIYIFKTVPRINTMVNHTVLMGFLLSGLSDLPSLQLPLFFFFLFIYLLTLTWNLLIISMIVTDSHLHTPMFFFLGNLASLDLCYASVTGPRMLFDLHTRSRSIAPAACLSQAFFFLFFAACEVFLLAVMSYDRYVAICRALHYMQVMRWRACVQMISGVWLLSFAYSLVQTSHTFRLRYGDSNLIESFFCDLPQLFQVSCSDVYITTILVFLLEVFLGVGCLTLTLMPYVYIFKTVLKMQVKGSRRKVFSTCSSHLTVVFVFYGTIMFNYFRPSADKHFVGDKVVAVFYTVLPPLLNPLIYSLRNRDLLTAFWDILMRINTELHLSWVSTLVRPF